MTQEPELEAPNVADVPEPDQPLDEPGPSDDDATEEEEAHEAETHEPEPAAEPEAQGLSPADWEKRFQKSDRAFDTYTRAISKIWEDDAVDLLPVVVSPSAPPGFLNKHDAGRVPDEVKTPILEFFGIAREKNYRPDPETHTCPTCDGEGKTETGSKVASFATRACPTCGGRGATGLDRAPQVPQGNGHKEEAFTLTSSGPLEAADVDNWGEPRFLPDGSVNENYGRQPQYKVEHPVYGRTAGLTAQDAKV
jgi:hypothetical protein